MSPPIQVTPSKLTLDDTLRLWRKGIFLDLNCHAVGTIQSFDPVAQTAQATINYTKTRLAVQPDGTSQPLSYEYAPLVDCPAVSLFGGFGGLTVPPKKGDECLVFFNDRSIDNWFSNQGPDLASPRTHAFTDAIVLVGIRSLANSIQNFDPDRPDLRNLDGSVHVRVGTSLVGILNNLFTLNQLMQQLITAIENLTVTCPPGGGPSSPPINVADFTAVATKFSQLLE